MVACKSDMLVKTKTGRVVMVGDVIKTLRACSGGHECVECACESVWDCMEHAIELAELAADVLEVLMED